MNEWKFDGYTNIELMKLYIDGCISKSTYYGIMRYRYGITECDDLSPFMANEEKIIPPEHIQFEGYIPKFDFTINGEPIEQPNCRCDLNIATSQADFALTEMAMQIAAINGDYKKAAEYRDQLIDKISIDSLLK